MPGVRQLSLAYQKINLMTVTKNFIRVWHLWRHADAPLANAFRRRTDAPTYSIELVLEHLASYLYSCGMDALAGKDLNYQRIASQELNDLEAASRVLERCEIAEEEKEKYREYIGLTRSLLEEIGKLPSANGAA